MQILISILLGLLVVVCFLALNHIVYKRESVLLEINWKYKAQLKALTKELDESRDYIAVLEEENDDYHDAINDCIENFNRVYSNTKLSFDEGKCAFVIEDIDTDDKSSTEEKINAQNENNDESN